MAVLDEEKRRAYNRAYREINKDRLAVQKKAYLAENRDKYLAYHRAKYQANKEAYRASFAAYRAANLEKIKARERLRKYGLTPDQHAALLARQNGRCAICAEGSPKGRGTWHVDHDHLTGTVRGLLCHACNTGLGNFRDDPALLNLALNYLLAVERPKEEA